MKTLFAILVLLLPFISAQAVSLSGRSTDETVCDLSPSTSYNLTKNVLFVEAGTRDEAEIYKAIAQVKISQRVYSSGRLKAFLNPFTPLTSESDAKATELVNKVGAEFVQELHKARGRRLSRDVDYGTGEVWSGMEAKVIGLVDEIGTMESLTGAKPTLKEFNYGPHDEGIAGLGTQFARSVVSMLSEAGAQSAVQLR